MELHESRVAATITGMLGYCSEAEDIGQETFMRFYRSLDRFEGRSAVGTYLVRIAINLSLNELKRRQRRHRLFLSSAEEKIESLPDQNQDANHTATRDNKNAVRQAIQQLEPRFRAVIVLRLIDGYSTQETAGILDLPTGTVLSRLARGQKKLKKILDPSAATVGKENANE